jgi:hypothetical protein
MRCTCHAVVCAGLLLRRGEQVTTRGGSALVVYPEQPPNEKAYFIAKHWWITTPEGLCDLSLDLRPLSNHKPVVFRNANLVDRSWKVVFKDDFQRIIKDSVACRAAGMCGVFYQTDAKRVVSRDACEADLTNVFPPAGDDGVPLRHLDIVLHCERFLSGGESALRLSQKETWRHLTRP